MRSLLPDVSFIRAIAPHHLQHPPGGRRGPQDYRSEQQRKNQKDGKRERDVIDQIHILLDLDPIHDAADDHAANHQHPQAEVDQLAAHRIVEEDAGIARIHQVQQHHHHHRKRRSESTP